MLIPNLLTKKGVQNSMDFLMQNFHRILKNKEGLNFTLNRCDDNSYMLTLKDLPAEIDLELISATYQDASDKRISVHDNITSKKGQKIIQICFSEENYALKINEIEPILMRHW